MGGEPVMNRISVLVKGTGQLDALAAMRGHMRRQPSMDPDEGPRQNPGTQASHLRLPASRTAIHKLLLLTPLCLGVFTTITPVDLDTLYPEF